MNLNDYIKQSYKRPNRQILESLGANERLIEYLMETPGNTNWQVVESIEGNSDPIGKTIHFTTTEFEYEGETITIVCAMNCGDAWDEIIEAANTDGMVPIAHGEGYISDQDTLIQINGQLYNFVSSNYPWRFPYGNDGRSIAIEDVREEMPDTPYTLIMPGTDGDLTIRYEIVEGYKITTQFEHPQLHEMVIATHYVKAGESFEFVPPVISSGTCATDGINTYHVGDIFTPTNDMTFTIIVCEE